jgi:hypothetical protein
MSEKYIYRCFHIDLLSGKRCNAIKVNPFGLCTKCCRFPIASHLKMLNLAKELDQLQSEKNQNRGISCVRTIVAFLYRGEVELAKNVYEVDGDKICSVYPDIDKMICVGLDLSPRYRNCGWQR